VSYLVAPRAIARSAARSNHSRSVSPSSSAARFQRSSWSGRGRTVTATSVSDYGLGLLHAIQASKSTRAREQFAHHIFVHAVRDPRSCRNRHAPTPLRLSSDARAAHDARELRHECSASACRCDGSTCVLRASAIRDVPLQTVATCGTCLSDAPLDRWRCRPVEHAFAWCVATGLAQIPETERSQADLIG
jgi:hypothetical protein